MERDNKMEEKKNIAQDNEAEMLEEIIEDKEPENDGTEKNKEQENEDRLNALV